MAEIKKRKKKNEKISYTATIRIKGHPSITKTFQRETDAKRWAAKTEAEIRDNINFPKRKFKKMTVSELINKFIEYELPKKKPKILKDFLKSLNWYKQEIGNTYLGTLTTALFVECREKLRRKPKEIPIANKQPKITDKRISNATINRYEGYMRSVFSYAVNDLDILDIHPMKKLKKLQEKNERKTDPGGRWSAWDPCGCSRSVLFFPCGKGGSRETDGGDCKLCQSAVLHLHPL